MFWSAILHYLIEYELWFKGHFQVRSVVHSHCFVLVCKILIIGLDDIEKGVVFVFDTNYFVVLCLLFTFMQTMSLTNCVFSPLQMRFWEEYQRESSPRPGGLESIAGGVHSLYLILPLLLVLLLIAAVSITVWRCHSRKRSQQSPAIGRPQRDTTLSVVSMDQWGRDYHPDISPHSEISAHSSPAYPGADLTPGRGSRGDPPPSYEEAVGHTDIQIEAEPPPQYEDIISNHGNTVMISRGKWRIFQACYPASWRDAFWYQYCKPCHSLHAVSLFSFIANDFVGFEHALAVYF